MKSGTRILNKKDHIVTYWTEVIKSYNDSKVLRGPCILTNKWRCVICSQADIREITKEQRNPECFALRRVAVKTNVAEHIIQMSY